MSLKIKNAVNVFVLAGLHLRDVCNLHLCSENVRDDPHKRVSCQLHTCMNTSKHIPV